MNKEEIFEILNDWNFWNKEIPKFKKRDKYEKELEKYDKTDEITILKGIRRCGKSTLLINHINNLIKNGIDSNQILFVNFEDSRFIENLNVFLLDKILDVYKEYINNNKEIYLFLDEIQEIKSWEKWVRTKYELKQIKKIYITGSSSKLLSKEFGTALSGRFLDIEVFPLSFKEYLSFKNIEIKSKNELILNKINLKKLFNDYYLEGGFPKIILTEKNLQKKETQNYYETIILKDIVARYNLKNYNNIKKVSYFLISNIGKQISLNNIKTSLNISYDLIENYYNYLKETYLIFDIEKYNYSLKKQFISPKKVYTIDLSFNHNIAFKFSEDKGRLLENLVFIELKRRGKEIFYHKNKKECDFVIRDGLDIVEAIQVTKSLNEDLTGETKKREFQGLIDAFKTYNLKEGLILTEDEEEEYIVNEKGREIRDKSLEMGDKYFRIIVKPIWKWLLE